MKTDATRSIPSLFLSMAVWTTARQDRLSVFLVLHPTTIFSRRHRFLLR